jgi:CheY-like chemotaxis protein
MHQALVNLIVNAKEAMPEGGLIQILAQNAVLTEGEVSSLRGGEYIKISLKDEGEGISEESLPRIFDPYFSTKQRGTQKGMGLGLTIAYSIIKRHEGHIEADSKPGMGTTFYVYLPACDTIAAEPAAHKEEPELEKVKVLLMDGQEMFRDMAGHMFEHVGCEVELAEGGTEAIRLFAEAKEAGKPFNLVILDLTVRGGMGGKDTIKELLKLDPSLKAVVSTGYCSDPVVLGFREYGFSGVLLKPYGIEQLRRTLQELL